MKVYVAALCLILYNAMSQIRNSDILYSVKYFLNTLRQVMKSLTGKKMNYYSLKILILRFKHMHSFNLKCICNSGKLAVHLNNGLLREKGVNFKQIETEETITL